MQLWWKVWNWKQYESNGKTRVIMSLPFSYSKLFSWNMLILLMRLWLQEEDRVQCAWWPVISLPPNKNHVCIKRSLKEPLLEQFLIYLFIFIPILNFIHTRKIPLEWRYKQSSVSVNTQQSRTLTGICHVNLQIWYPRKSFTNLNRQNNRWKRKNKSKVS